MKSIHFKSHIITILTLIIFSCENDKPFLEISYDEWTVTGDGLSAPVTKNVLTEFVGSTNCPYSPEQMLFYLVILIMSMKIMLATLLLLIGF